MTDTELQNLLRHGTAAARVGDRDAAQKAFRQATRLAPESQEAWLGLAGTMENLAEKRACFERVLVLNPNNADAQAGLAWIERKEREQTESLATSVQPDPIVSSEPAEDETVFCHYHPDRETMLRCNRCSKPICVKCARRTPVGYRCPECIREQQSVYFTAGWLDYVFATVVGLVASAIGAAIVASLGTIWLVIILGPAAGGVIAEVTRWATRKRRGRYMAYLVSGCIVVGALPTLFFVGFNLLSLGGLGLYIAIAVATAYARLH